MGCAVELSDVHDIVFVFEDGSFVVIHVEVVRGAEDGHYTRESGCPSLSVHAVTGILSFVGSDDR